MDSQMRDEDIFYSDDEFSDSEDFYQVASKSHVKTNQLVFSQVPDYNNSKAGGSIFYQHGGSSLIENQQMSKTIDRPVNQISMGMAGMGLGGNFLNHDRLVDKEPILSETLYIWQKH